MHRTKRNPKTTLTYLVPLLLTALLTPSFAVFAQESAQEMESNRLRIQAGAFYDDNITAQNTQLQDSGGAHLDASLGLTGSFRNFKSVVTWDSHSTQYSDADSFDHTDTAVTLQNQLKTADKQHSIHLNGLLDIDNQLPGSGLSQGYRALTLDEPIKQTRSRYEALYQYEPARGNRSLVIGFSIEEYDYANYHGFTASRDRREQTIYGTFYSRLNPHTRIFFSPQLREVIYLNEGTEPQGITLDSDAGLFNVGLEFTNEYGFSGQAQAGLTHRVFSSSARGEFIGSNWDVNLQWQPLAKSSFVIQSTRSDQEAVGEESYIDVKTLTFGWLHTWGANIHSRFNIGWQRDKFRFDEKDLRDDLGGYGELNIEAHTPYKLWIKTTIRFAENTSSDYQFEHQRSYAQLSLGYKFF